MTLRKPRDQRRNPQDLRAARCHTSACAPRPRATINDASVPSSPPLLKIYGPLASSDGYALRDFLHRSDVPFEWISLKDNSEAREQAGVAHVRDSGLPVCVFADGTRLECPTIRQNTEKLGWFCNPSRSEYDLAILRRGACGFKGAVYGSSDGLKTVLGTKLVARASICATGLEYSRLGAPNVMNRRDRPW